MGLRHPTTQVTPKEDRLNKKRRFALLIAVLMALSACQTKAPGAPSSSGEAPAQASAQESRGSQEDPSSIREITPEEMAAKPLSQGEYIEDAEGKKIYQGQGTFFDTFDTVVTLTYFAPDEETFQKYLTYTHDEFLRLHKLYDNYHEYEGLTSVMTVNRLAGKGPVEVDPDLFDVLAFSLDHYEASLGKVNIALGPVLSLWHEAREAAGVHEGTGSASGGQDQSETIESHGSASDKEARLPDPAALEEANRHTDPAKLRLDKKARTVAFDDPKMALDLGAVAKGYATEKVAKGLEAMGLKNGLLSAGGNVRLFGNHPQGRPWKVGVEDPKTNDRDQALAAMKMEAGSSMVTSGDYQRFFIVDGKRYNHIIDPKTLYPGTLYPSVSVVTGDSGLADFLSTTFFLCNREEATQVLENYKKEGIDLGVIWVDFNNRVTSTDNLSGALEVRN